VSKILIVEDDPAIGCALEDDLQLEGYRVELVKNGNDAVAASHQTLSLELARAYGGSVLVAFSMNIAARLTFARGQTRQAVVLQGAADRVLTDASFVMFDEDAEVRARLMSAAHDELGDDFGAALAEGEGLDHDAAADLAAAVLAEVRGEATQQEAVR